MREVFVNCIKLVDRLILIHKNRGYVVFNDSYLSVFYKTVGTMNVFAGQALFYSSVICS